MRYYYLTKKDLLNIHEEALKTGGIDGLVSEGMLELALGTPQTSLLGTEVYDTLFRKAAAIMHEIIKLTPFVDGNKRTAYLAADTFLRVNGCEMRTSLQDAIDTCLKTSMCSINIVEIADWIQTNSVSRRME